MRARPPALLARLLEPFAGSLWILFLLWTLLVAIVWPLGFGAAELDAAVPHEDLRNALALFLDALDPIWITLAAANIYLALSAEEGLAVARRWALIVIAVATVVTALSAATALPLGPIHYTSRLGPRIGLVPLALPLWWFCTVCGARALVLRLTPRASHLQVTFVTGALAVLADTNLEPLAWKTRAFWIWYPAMISPPDWPPIQNYGTWFIVSTGCAFLMRETRVAHRQAVAFPIPALVFLLLNGALLITHLARWGQD